MIPAMTTALPATHRQQSLIDHVTRYRMTVVPVIERLTGFRGLSRRVLREELQQLCCSGTLGAAPLYRDRHYYYLAGAGHHAGTGPNDAASRHFGPLSEVAKIRNYAMLSFCCLSQQRRQRLTAEDIERFVPDLYRIGMPSSYYVEADGPQSRLGFLRVDTGGHSRWDRILAKAREDIRTHSLFQSIREFVARGLFEVSIVTALPQKATRLQQAIEEWPAEQQSLIRVVACPELINLIAPPPGTARNKS